MRVSVSEIRAECADREAIRHCLYRFCRGVDRVDETLIRGAFWPNATAEYGNFDATSADDFISKSLAVLRTLEMASHDLGNILIDIRGDVACVESYVRAIQRIPKPTAGTYDYVSASRYLDQMERRHDEWRIKHRTIVRDWFREFPDSFHWEEGTFPKAAGYGKQRPLTVGQRKPDDVSYKLFDLPQSLKSG
jgi:SnoaL-like domain